MDEKGRDNTVAEIWDNINCWKGKAKQQKHVVETGGGKECVIIQARSLGPAEDDLGNKKCKVNLKTEQSFKEELRTLEQRNGTKESQDGDHVRRLEKR